MDKRDWEHFCISNNWGKEWQSTLLFLPREPHGQYEKAKDMTSEDEPPQIGRCPVCCRGRVGGNC